MKVYVAVGESFDGSLVYGVYSSPEAAREALTRVVEEEKTLRYAPYTAFTWYKYYPVELDGVAISPWSNEEFEEGVMVLDMEKYNDDVLDNELGNKYVLRAGEFSDL